MKSNKAFFLVLVSLFCFITFAQYIIGELKPEWVNWKLFWANQAFFVVVMTVSHLLSGLGLKNNADEFNTFYMASMGFRFLMALIYLFAMVYFNQPLAWILVINFFILYLVYTSFEIYSLMANLRTEN